MRRATTITALSLAVVLAMAPVAADATPMIVVEQPDAAAAPVADARELVAAPPEDDGRHVVYEGEAIGDSLRADQGRRWINLLDDGVTIGVVVTQEMADRVTRYGEWGMRGDRVRVSGILRVACDEHGGDLDIHADSLEVVAEGGRVSHPVSVWKAIAIGASAPAIAVLAHALRRRRARSRV